MPGSGPLFPEKPIGTTRPLKLNNPFCFFLSDYSVSFSVANNVNNVRGHFVNRVGIDKAATPPQRGIATASSG
jgi:hypothetical protein